MAQKLNSNRREWFAVILLYYRFIRSKSSEGFLSFIAWVSILGIALGVMALTVVTSVVNGFEGELARVISGKNGQVILYSRGDAIASPDQVEKKIRTVAPETLDVSQAFVSQIMVAGPHGAYGAVLEGVDLKTVARVTDLPNQVREGRMPQDESEVGMGSVLAEKLGLKIGMEVRLIAPYSGLSEGTQGAPKSSRKKVVGLVTYGMYDYDSKYVFGELGAIQKFMDSEARVTAFKLRLSDGNKSRVVSDRLNDHFGYPFRAKDWGQLNKNIFYAIQLEKVVISVLLTVIIFVAAFNIVSALMMMIHEKARDIAILKAMGLSHSSVFAVFSGIGASFGAAGTLLGVVAGLFLNAILGRFHWLELPSDIYYISFLPVVVRWGEVALIAGGAFLISLIATFYPAFRVMRQSPLTGIRYD